MKHKLLSYISLLFLAAVGAVGAFAQSTAIGTWEFVSPFHDVDQVVETPGRVYFRSQGSLYCLDRETEETLALNTSNRLNGTGVTGLFAHPTDGSVVVAYEDGNLDRLYDDGRVVNLPDFRDAIITDTHTINDVAFTDPELDKMYVATRIGLITFSDSRNEVRETLYTPQSVWSVAVAGDHALLLIGVPNNRLNCYVYHADATAPLTRMDQLKMFNTRSGATFFPNGQNFYKVYGDGPNHAYITISYLLGMVCHFNIDWENNTVAYSELFDPQRRTLKGAYQPCRTSDGGYAFPGSDAIFLTDKAGKVTTYPLPEKLVGRKLSLREGVGKVWAGNTDGLGLYALNDKAPEEVPTELRAPARPAPMSVRTVNRLDLTPSGNILVYNARDEFNPLDLDVLRPDGTYTRLSPEEGVTAHYPQNPSVNRHENPMHINTAYCVVEDPDDAGAYYAGAWFEGLYRFKEGKQTHHYNLDNAPFGEIVADYAAPVTELLIDPQGVLWEFQEVPEGSTQLAALLPAARKKSQGAVTAADWKRPAVNGFKGERNGRALMLPDGQTWIYYGAFGLLSYNTAGTPSLSDDSYTLATSYVDQDSKYFNSETGTAVALDRRGRLWLGSTAGVVEIADPRSIASGTTTINHLKVPRNDGTNLADYLLDNQAVTAISVDASNRKWISTRESGLYLVSENGDAILEHFTKDNSPLPSNNVGAVLCDPNSNIVYVGTPEGLFKYRSTSGPAAETYGDVYAFPNPVRPDFSGSITIANLKDNSLVKIADAQGSVVFQGRSEGGMMQWDGCNLSGERVHSGVYYVFASENASGSSSGAVTKILIVR